VPKATKRERQRQNREMRREAMMQAERRRKRFRTARTIGLLLIPIVIIFVIIQLVSGGDSGSSSAAASIKCSNRKPATPVKTQTFTAVPPTTIDVTAQYSAVLHTSCGDIQIALDSKLAPVAVNNFLFLIQNEYYNGTTFNRIVTDFVNQGGSQTPDGQGSPGYTLPLEPPANGYKAGDVAMAARSDGSISGSQFFLVVSKNGADQLGTTPPYKYSILGHMDAHGLKVAQKINTFGSATEVGTPTKTIYVFDVGIIPPQGASTSTTTGETTTTPPDTTLAP
jgi:peptidyl-prolyl cis-trans isomerase B (cyclophilin B)